MNEWKYTSALWQGQGIFRQHVQAGCGAHFLFSGYRELRGRGLDADRSHPVVRLRVGGDIRLPISDVMTCVGKTLPLT